MRRVVLGAALLVGLAVPFGGIAGGQELPTCNGLPATIVGTEGRDNLRGTPGDDVIVGLGGPDRIVGLGGHDVICGGEGRDRIRGNSGRDLIFGDGGRDRLLGGGGDDVIRGMGGNDLIDGGGGDDVIRGNRGRDRIAGGEGLDDCFDDDASLTGCEVLNDGVWVRPDDPVDAGSFGRDVAIFENTIVVASDIAPTEVDGVFGVAWVYTSDGAGGYVGERLEVPGGPIGRGFGASVAIEDGLIVVGAHSHELTGSLVLFRRSAGGDWEFDSFLRSNMRAKELGTTVAIDEGSIVSGSPRGSDSSAHVFHPDGNGGWVEHLIETPEGTTAKSFGSSVDIGGDVVIVGDPIANSRGRAFIYRWQGAGYGLVAMLERSVPGASRFGSSVAVDGNLILVGEAGMATEVGDVGGGGVHKYDLRTVRTGSSSELLFATLEPGTAGRTGTSVAISDNYVVIGSPWARPSAYRVFPRDGVMVGAPTVTESPTMPFSDGLGGSVAVSDGIVVAGAPGKDYNDLQNPGEIHVRRLD